MSKQNALIAAAVVFGLFAIIDVSAIVMNETRELERETQVWECTGQGIHRHEVHGGWIYSICRKDGTKGVVFVPNK